MTDPTPPSWFEDPTGRHDHRYWDGARWTEHVADAGVAGVDPYDDHIPTGPDPAAVTDSQLVWKATDVVRGAPTTADWGWARAAGSDDTKPSPPSLSGWTNPSAGATSSGAARSGPPTAAVRPPALRPAPEAKHSGSPAREEAEEPAGPRRRWRSTRLVLLAVILVVSLVVAIVVTKVHDDDGNAAGAIASRIADALQGGSGPLGELSDDQAQCVGDHIVAELGTERLADLDFGADVAPPEISDDLSASLTQAVDTCVPARSPAPSAPIGSTGG